VAYTAEELKYETVLQSTYGGLLTGDARRDRWLHRQAEDLHARIVTDAIREVAVNAVILSQRPLERDAVFHLRFGVAHRTKFIWLALRRLLAIAPAERTHPISLEDVETLASDLNVIYLNVRGTLDNLAWTIRAQNPGRATAELRDQHMDLFGARFLAAVDDEYLRGALEPFRAWYGDLKGRRDPAAHRIPLSIPPAVLDEPAQQEYANLDRQHGAATTEAVAAIRREDPDRPLTLAEATAVGALFERAHAIHERRQEVGKFPGLFVHHPDQAAIPIYPTVAEDVGNLVAIARLVTQIVEPNA
jgi:hypothetical protein